VWLHRVVAGGRLIPGTGRENLYHAMTPPSVLDEVRARKLAALQEKTGVAIKHPGGLKEKVRSARKTGVSGRDANRGGGKPHVLCTVIQVSNSRESTPGAGSAEWRNGRSYGSGIDPNYGVGIEEEAGHE